jgi:hypothetical protein
VERGSRCELSSHESKEKDVQEDLLLMKSKKGREEWGFYSRRCYLPYPKVLPYFMPSFDPADGVTINSSCAVNTRQYQLHKLASCRQVSLASVLCPLSSPSQFSLARLLAQPFNRPRECLTVRNRASLRH